ncbi:MAG: helix-turn-helix domain-containing protein [Prevotellaceae bacterium]|jgi:transcriptional regulator with XRE-family HTH domain|nr:helix-turn-helix domain-containing protein [Prevotellaceae bacterium]
MNEKYMATLGTKLIILRKKYKLTQMEIADSIGVSQNAYAQWEADKCKPIISNLLKLSQYFKVDVNELLDDNE